MRTGTGMFIGVFFLLLGISILIKVLFKLDLPLIRMSIAVFLIYFGIRMLTTGFQISSIWQGKDKDSAVFTNRSFNFNEAGPDSNQYNVVFGRSKIDLTKVPVDKQNVFVEINTVFGEAIVYLHPATPFVIRSNAVFSEAKMPDDNMVAFGSLKYSNATAKKGAPHILTVHGNVVFGSLRFEEKP